MSKLTKDERYALEKLVEYDGLRTFRLAGLAGMSTAAVRRMLNRMEDRFEVERHHRYSAVNDIYWIASPAGRLALQQEANP